MRRLAVALVLLAVTGPSARGQASYRVTWRDAASVGVAVGVALIPHAAGLPSGPPPCAPCDPATLSRLDRVALHTFSTEAATASNFLLLGVTAGSAAVLLEGADAARARADIAVFGNALVWTLAATEWLKAAAHRSRPVLYTAAASAAASDRENRRSFPSGHASWAFAAATSYVVISGRDHLRHRARNAVLLYAGALGVSVLRVAAGKHFPTDVLGGAALGTGIGWLAAKVHPTQP